MPDRTYTYSQLSAVSAGHLVKTHYQLRTPLRSMFYVLGLHDNYLIESGGEKYILRIYRNAWRNQEDINFELTLLAYLRERQAPVAAPLPTVAGELSFQIESPEGIRMAALFYYAQGYAPENAISAEECALLGRVVANVHITADAFTTPYSRPILDIPYLLDESIVAIKPFIDSTSQRYLENLQAKLHAASHGLTKEAGVFGICMGDVNPKNFHIAKDKHITLFDFDQCGYGYRAFEIGKFSSSLHGHKMQHELLSAFLDGYQQVRPLSSVEIETIPYFELVSIIWVMAIHAQNADRIGYKLLEKPYWDRRLAILKALDIH